MSAAWDMVLREAADQEELETEYSYFSCHIHLGDKTCKELRFSTNTPKNIVTDYISYFNSSTSIGLARYMIEARVDHLQKIVDGWRLINGRFSHQTALNLINEFLSDNNLIPEFELQNFSGQAAWSAQKPTRGISKEVADGTFVTKKRREAMEDNIIPPTDWLYSNKIHDFDPITKGEAFYRARTQRLLLGRDIPKPSEWHFEDYIASLRADLFNRKPILEHTPSTKRLICSFLGKCTDTKFREFRLRYTTEMMNFKMPDLYDLTRYVKFRCQLRRDRSQYKYMWDAVARGVTINSAPYLHAMFEAGEQAVEEFERDNDASKQTITWAEELPLEYFIKFFNRTIHYETSQNAEKIIEDDPIATQSGIDFMEKFKMSGDRRAAFNKVVFDTAPLTEADLYPSPPANGNQSDQTENDAHSEQNTIEVEPNNDTINAETMSAKTTASSSLSSRVSSPQFDEEVTNGDVADPKPVAANESAPASLQSLTPTLSYAKALKKSTSDVAAAKNSVQQAANPAQDIVPSVPVIAAEEAVLKVQENQQATTNNNRSRRGKNSKKNYNKNKNRERVVAQQNGGLSSKTQPMNGNNANGATPGTSEQIRKLSGPPKQSIAQPPQKQIANGKSDRDAAIQPPDSSNSSNDVKAVAANQNGVVSPQNQEKQKKTEGVVTKKEETKTADSNLENDARIFSVNQNGHAGTSNKKQTKNVKSKASAEKKKVQDQIPNQAVQAEPPAQREENQVPVPAPDGHAPQLNSGELDVDVVHVALEPVPNSVAPHPEGINGVPEQRVAEDQANPAVAIEPDVVNIVPEQEALPVAPELDASNNTPEQGIVTVALEPHKEEDDEPGTSEKSLSKSQRRKVKKAAIKASEKEKEKGEDAAMLDAASTGIVHNLIMFSDDKSSVEANISVRVKSGKNVTPNRNKNIASPETIIVKADFAEDSAAVVINGDALADEDAVQHPELPVSSSNSDNEEGTSTAQGSTKICTFDYRPGVRSSEDDDAPEREGTEMQLMNSKGCSAGNDYDDEHEAVPSDPAPGSGASANRYNLVRYVASDINKHNLYQKLFHLSNNRRLLFNIEHSKEKLVYMRLQKFRNIYFYRRRIARAMLYIHQEEEGAREAVMLDKVMLYLLVEFDNDPNSSLVKQIDEMTKNITTDEARDSDSIHRGLRFIDLRLAALDPKSPNFQAYTRICEKLLKATVQADMVFGIVKDKVNFNGYEGYIKPGY